MADKNLLNQMLEHLVNDDQAKAEELFHEYVVAKSREIYEGLIESEMTDDEDEEVEEAADAEKEDEEDLEENFEDIAVEADDEMGGDPTDDLAGELDAEMGDEGEGEQSEEEIMQDLGDIIDELQAKFDALTGSEEEQGEFGGEEEGEGEEGGNPFAKEEDFDLETVREYVEKVPAGHGAEKKGAAESGADKSAGSLKFSKNDMGGTSANILSGRNGSDAGEQGMSGDLKGSALLKGKPQLQDGGNVNTPGAKNGNAFSKKEPGHGAEKAGSKESADKSAGSLFRGRR